MQLNLRLIHKQAIGILGERARKHNALAFASAELAEDLRCQACGVRQSHGLARPFDVTRAVENRPGTMRQSSHHDDFTGREWKHHMRFLRYERDSLGEVSRIPLRERFPGEVQ